MILELISRVSKTSRQAHFAHWATSSFAQHEALGSFYSDVIDKLDSFVENYQIYFNPVGTISIEAFSTPEDIIPIFKEDCRWLNKNRNQICRNIASLQNLFDELTTVYTLTLYKLTYLR